MTGSLTDVTKRVLVEVERLKIEETLREAEGNKGRAAELLQVSYKSLVSKLREYRME
jgi:DNA-binding NtrC family response regulator